MHITQIADLAITLDGDAFSARLPMPVLVPSELIATGESSGGFRTQALDLPRAATPRSLTSSDIARTTHHEGRTPTASSLDAGPGAPGDAQVILLAKSDRNPFQQMITVGRSPNNDIALRDKTVSKLHAYFIERKGGWLLYDQGSTNGTFVDGLRVGAQGTRLTDGCLISFGQRISLRFYTPRALHDVLCHSEG
jgi:hypothetical protein